MDIRRPDDWKNNVKMRKGRAVLRNDFSIADGDEYFYGFIGSNSKLYFYKLIHEDYRDEFLSICNDTDREDIRVVTLMSDGFSVYHVVDIYIKKDTDKLTGELIYRLEIYEIDRIEQIYTNSLMSLNKYRAIMGLIDYVYLEYWPETRLVVLYKYILRKAHKLYEGDVDQWYNEVIKYAYNDEKNLAEIDKLYHSMIAINNQLSATIQSGFLNENHKVETLEIKAKYIMTDNTKLIIGAVKRDKSDDENMPYYTTAAGLDSATGLLNKKSIIEYTNDVFAADDKKKHYMLLIDIDDFKDINDNFGHLVGDKVILFVSQVLHDVLGARGIVGRFGGDEFFILTDNIETEEKLRIFLKTLISALRSGAVEEIPGVNLTLSIGVALYPDNGKNYTEMFEVADKALYIAKEKGKARYIIYRPGIHDSYGVTAKMNSSGKYGYIEQSKAIKVIIKEIISSGIKTMDSVIDLICRTFNIDNVSIYYGEDLKLIYSGDRFSLGYEKADFMKADGYMSLFDTEGNNIVHSIDNRIERVNKEVWESFAKVNCASVVQICFPVNEPNCLVSFEIYGNKHKWSESEINFFNICATMIYEAIKKVHSK